MFDKQKIINRAISSLWAGAVADAIGNYLEFTPKVSKAAFNKQCKGPLRITDDTQMTLFVWDALLRDASPREAICAWYRTQIMQFGGSAPGKGSPLHQFKTLNHTEAPGATCMASAYCLLKGREAKNTSKGNGTVMRASPYAFFGAATGLTEAQARALSAVDAKLTHKHPDAAASSEMLVSILYGLFLGMDFTRAVLAAECSSVEVCDLVVSMLPVNGNRAWNSLRSRRCGWVAEEALALAVGAVARGVDYLDVIFLACNGYNCDSDTVASIAGQLASQMDWYSPPQPLIPNLVAYAPIHYTANAIHSRLS